MQSQSQFDAQPSDHFNLLLHLRVSNTTCQAEADLANTWILSVDTDAPEKNSAPGGVGEPSACREDAGTCAIGTVCSRALPARLSHPSGPATRKPSTRDPSSPLLYLYPDTASSF